MPLLMLDPDPGPLPPESDIVVEGGGAVALPVARGQLLGVETPTGGQVASLFAWVTGELEEWLSPHHTRVFGGTFQLRMGTRMVTNRRRPMFVVGRDSLRRHDLLLPASMPTVEAVLGALATAGVGVPRVPDPVNLFLDSTLHADGRIEIRECQARPGERWTVRTLINGIVVVSAGPTGIPEASASPPRPIRIRVTNRVEDLPEDLPPFGS